jgi:hypothetical protein
MSSEQPSAMSIKLLGQNALTIAHIVVNMNLNKRQQVLKRQKKDKSSRHNLITKSETLFHETK